ncbi:hypothetical protein IFM89_010532 [Coptis chinensis]|uniref:Cytochrome P450 n=1 Tax=Coptis chinensis TaxID=261450 RepID=A0A835HVB0_9MAGN|nr:hypothetical protein IFM89_010532 [Coptis chinensis]
MYRTYLFGSPSIIACSPAFIKFVLQSSDLFSQRWPSAALFGQNSLVVVDGKPHSRLRSYVSNSINRPDALRKITKMVQPHIVSSLRSWAEKGRVKGLDEARKITFENICNIFVSFKPGPLLDMMDQYFSGVLGGVRAQPLNIPGTAYYRALQCRKNLMAIFRKELEKRKQSGTTSEDKNDLMEGLMRMRDEEGKLLSDEEVLDNIVTLVLGGYESTSHSIMWALYYLAKHPDVVHKIREESLALGKNGDFIKWEDLAQLKYTNKVVEETTRMANISAFVFRVVKKQATYQDPKNFEDPMNFNPDRWNEPPKHLEQDKGFVQATCLLEFNLPFFFIIWSRGYKWELMNPDANITYLPLPKPEDRLEIAFSRIWQTRDCFQ